MQFVNKCSSVGIRIASLLKNIIIYARLQKGKLKSRRADALFEAVIDGKPVDFSEFL